MIFCISSFLIILGLKVCLATSLVPSFWVKLIVFKASVNVSIFESDKNNNVVNGSVQIFFSFHHIF